MVSGFGFRVSGLFLGMPVHVLVCDPLPEEAVGRMRKAGLIVDVRTGLAPADLLSAAAHYEAILVRSATRIPREVIAAGKRLRLVARAGVGLDNVDAIAARERGIDVANTPTATSVSVAELAIGLMFSLARSIPNAHGSTAGGLWEKKRFAGTELAGKTLGLVGFGSIAKETAKRAQALGMKVICNRKRMTEEGEIERMGIELHSLESLLALSDFVSIHVPLTLSTKHLIGPVQLAQMKKGAFLVHCARGGVVDEAALAEALKEGRLAGAAVDVFETEPIERDNPLLSAPNAILTPHLGASTEEAQLRAGLEVAELVIRFFTK